MSGKTKKILIGALAWLVRVAVFPMLAAWVLVRLWIPWGGVFPDENLVLAALVTAAALLILEAACRLTPRILLPWKTWWKNLLSVIPPLLLGWYFDISCVMPTARLPKLQWLPEGLDLDALCHLGNAVVFAFIVMALLKAGRDVIGVAKADWKQLLVILVCLNLATALYSFTSNTVYIWDNAGYWSIARTLAAEDISAYEQILAVLQSTLTEDYNYLLAYPISLVMRLFGPSRTVFLFALSNLYTFPALWGFTSLANSKKWSGLVVASLFPMLGYTGLVGMVDVACCGMGIWAYNVYTSDKPAVSRGIMTGALLVGTFLCRRYFLFFAASFGLAVFVAKVFFDHKKWWDFLALCCSTAVCGVAFSLRFLLDKVLEPDYGDIYSAYYLGLEADFLSFCRYFGLVLLVLFLIAALVDMSQKEDRFKITLGLVQIAACFTAFVQVQSHGQQHLLMYLPPIAFVAVYALARAPQYMSAFLAISTAVYCFFPKIQPASIKDIETPDLFPSFHFYGPQRSDMDELLRLADYLDSLSQREEKTAVVLASSFTLNYETIASVRASMDLPEPEVKTTLQYHGTVDKRDAFNWNTAFAEYVVVGDPVQTHLGEENQQTLAILAQHILDGTGPGKAYIQLAPTFELANGVTVRIYKQLRPWHIEEYHDISDALIELYPEYEELYSIPAWIE